MPKFKNDHEFRKIQNKMKIKCCHLDEDGNACKQLAQYRFNVHLASDLYDWKARWVLTYSCKEHVPSTYSEYIK